MLVLLYTLFILYISYKYKNNLVLYVLENYDTLVRYYNNFILTDHIKFGFTINEFHIQNISTSVYCRVSYNIGNKTYYIYLNKACMSDYINGFRLNLGIPYNYNEIKNSDMTDDDIIMSYVKCNDREIDITEYCKMIAGPKGNFYNDCDINRIDKDVIIEDMKRWLLDNKRCNKEDLLRIDYNINYMTSLGDELKWTMN